MSTFENQNNYNHDLPQQPVMCSRNLFGNGTVIAFQKLMICLMGKHRLKLIFCKSNYDSKPIKEAWQRDSNMVFKPQKFGYTKNKPLQEDTTESVKVPEMLKHAWVSDISGKSSGPLENDHGGEAVIQDFKASHHCSPLCGLLGLQKCDVPYVEQARVDKN
ncbi:hypothetical protein DFH28DRAFT_927815 [Melampsora americana]|nr:hypothetical protein DFH28DRAFT_927815 [Melampsora americana]